MCSSPGAYVEAKVTRRLIERGVDPERAQAVGRKVRRAYEAKHAHAWSRRHLDIRS